MKIKKEGNYYNIYIDGVLIDWIYKVTDCGRSYYSWSKNVLPQRINGCTCFFTLNDTKEEITLLLTA